MLHRKLKFLLLLPLCMLLFACHSRRQYVNFIKDRYSLQQTLTTCGNHTSDLCLTARATAQAINQFASLANAKRSVFIQAQNAGSAASLDSDARQQLIRAESDVEEQFGQQVMFAQIRLVKLEQALKKTHNSQQRAAINTKLNYQRHLVNAMLALISVNEHENV